MKKRIFMFLAAAMAAMCAHAEPTVTDVTADKKVQANGTYKLLRDAQAEHGAVAYDNKGMRVTVVDLHDKVQLWEGGPYWATTNIGAENPEDYGYYFWWGDTVGYKRVNNAWVASDGSSSNFSFSEDNTPTYGKSIATLKSKGWILRGQSPAGIIAKCHGKNSPNVMVKMRQVSWWS